MKNYLKNKTAINYGEKLLKLQNNGVRTIHCLEIPRRQKLSFSEERGWKWNSKTQN